MQNPDEVAVIGNKRPARKPVPDDLTLSWNGFLRDKAVLAVVTGQGIEPEWVSTLP